MASKLGAAVLAVVGLGLIGVALASSLPRIAPAGTPTIGWLARRGPVAGVSRASAPAAAAAAPAAAHAAAHAAAAQAEPSAEPAGFAPGNGGLAITCAAAGADVIVDDASVGRAPIELELSEGAHKVAVVLPNGKEKKQAVKVKAGETVTVAISF